MRLLKFLEIKRSEEILSADTVSNMRNLYFEVSNNRGNWLIDYLEKQSLDCLGFFCRAVHYSPAKRRGLPFPSRLSYAGLHFY